MIEVTKDVTPDFLVTKALTPGARYRVDRRARHRDRRRPSVCVPRPAGHLNRSRCLTTSRAQGETMLERKIPVDDFLLSNNEGKRVRVTFEGRIDDDGDLVHSHVGGGYLSRHDLGQATEIAELATLPTAVGSVVVTHAGEHLFKSSPSGWRNRHGGLVRDITTDTVGRVLFDAAEEIPF